jgi:CheY-like chemotaxis protein
MLIEDDLDDRMFLSDVLRELGIHRPIEYFDTTDEAKQYLLAATAAPFIILCDVNLPRKNGLEFKREIESNAILREKSIPFIFYSTVADLSSVRQAYTEHTVQGFFRKPDTFQEAKRTMQVIFDYWSLCKHPNA